MKGNKQNLYLQHLYLHLIKKLKKTQPHPRFELGTPSFPQIKIRREVRFHCANGGNFNNAQKLQNCCTGSGTSSFLWGCVTGGWSGGLCD
jgi:hypothetical protein